MIIVYWRGEVTAQNGSLADNARHRGGTSTTEFVTSPGFVLDFLPRNEHVRMKLSFSLNGNGTFE